MQEAANIEIDVKVIGKAVGGCNSRGRRMDGFVVSNRQGYDDVAASEKESEWYAYKSWRGPSKETQSCRATSRVDADLQ